MINSAVSKNYILIILIATSFLSFFFVDPIPQDLSYHLFADSRKLYGINNFFDVASNLPFLIIGIIALRHTFLLWNSYDSWCWLFLFASVLLVSFGSGYYHLNPNNETLVWDRLPMAIGFMALFVVVIGDYVDLRLRNWLLVPMSLLGILSVLYWHVTDDLRLYAWVQFVSMGLLLIIIFMYHPSTLRTKYLIYAFVFYTLSKVTEYFDMEIFNYFSEKISGHTIKHLLAAVSTLYFYILMKYRAN